MTNATTGIVLISQDGDEVQSRLHILAFMMSLQQARANPFFPMIQVANVLCKCTVLAPPDTTHFSKAKLIDFESRLRHCPTIHQRFRNSTRSLGSKIAMNRMCGINHHQKSPKLQLLSADIGCWGQLPNIPRRKKVTLFMRRMREKESQFSQSPNISSPFDVDTLIPRGY